MEHQLYNQLIKDFEDQSLYEKALSFGLEYMEQVRDRNVDPTESAVQALEAFDEEFPETSVPAKEVMQQLHQFGSPATMAQLGGRYFGFVNGSVVPVGLAAKTLATFWDQNSALAVMSPLVSKLETVVQNWFVDLFGFPKNTVAGFVSGTSAANLCGLAAGRFRLLNNQGWDIHKKGTFGAPKIRVITGKQAHSSAIRALWLLGFGEEDIEYVEVDEQGRMKAELLPELDSTCLVVLQAGNVNSGAFDPFEAICQKAQAAKAWVHVDGAFGLWAGALDQMKHLTKGMEMANSWAVDGHKTLNTPYDSGIVMCNDEQALVSSLHTKGSYLVLSEEKDGMFYTPDMSRRSRIIELWAIMKYLGKAGINQMIYGLHERAVQFAEELSHADGFEVLNDVVFNQVLVQCETDELTERTMKRIQELRTCWVGGSSWFGRKVIRISVCSWVTNEEDVRLSVESFKLALSQVKEEMQSIV
ncbi:MAG: aminotransferase class V-fold PLP-dependent enzyme [Bacteroidota bacterium]